MAVLVSLEGEMSYNQLSDAEAERLALLLEECGEVQQIIGKILRHGYESCHPLSINGSPTNRELLERELGDVYAAVSMMLTGGDIKISNLQGYMISKQQRVQQYLHHQNARI
jgi:NTP pyrophosphatase (non-canonical NTP hydrolase)